MRSFVMTCGVVILSALVLSGTACTDDKKADDKKKDKSAVGDAKFSCPVHGPDHMVITLSLEPTPAGEKPRDIKMTARGGQKWIVTIDGALAPVGGGGENKDTVKVRSKDTITWVLAANTHGVAFADKDLAGGTDGMLKFEVVAGQTLEDLTTLTSQEWKDFGSKLWGIKRQDAGASETVMAKAVVK